ncbi:Homocitrate dehydratase, mitochondrial [Ceratocystis fimbriata CBS 114723]|uniref:Large ribosomal subunit protein bL21m n=1 Tax=Ceratocystis fimbriata CBS 114723 TaxID=1035309 RepID=A0A2C5WVK9_9PEZI|nr:Homocitrate dehydratase, mitochondrial [Ceratocystis fimbriata CBS 114723]
MSRTLLRSITGIRATATPRLGLPCTVLAQPFTAVRRFNSTTPIIESTTTTTTTTSSSLTTPQHSKAISESVRSLLPVLAAQPSHYVTIHIHGWPFLVTKGDSVRLPFRMPGSEPGDELKLNCASVLGSRDLTLKGSPYIDERLFECRAIVVGEEAEPMREKIKTKRRNRKAKKAKSKHRYTILRISDLKINEVPV